MSETWSSATRYLYVFTSSIVVNIIFHFLAYQRYTGNIMFIPHQIGSLMIYYKDLRILPPEFEFSGLKAFVYGCLIAGIIGILILFISDLLFLKI